MLSCAPTTVKFHLRNVLQKFGVETRSQLQQLPNNWDFESGKIDHFSLNAGTRQPAAAS
ncbi:MAG: LuxR C-terminal-related transcriptional regulator [Bacteroidota bacterium]